MAARTTPASARPAATLGRRPALAARERGGRAGEEPERGVAEGAGHGDEVPRTGARAEHRSPLRDRPEDRHRDGERAGAGHVPPDDRDPVRARTGAEAPRDPPHRRDARRGRERERHQGADGAGAHGGEVGEVHRERLPADVGRGGAAVEVDARDHRVHRHDEVLAGGGTEHRRVVARADDDAALRGAGARA